jgi:hypothetical protein
MPPVSLERTLQVSIGKHRKSRSSDCFSVLASSGLILPCIRCFLSILHLFLIKIIYIYIYIYIGENLQDIFLAYQILYVFSHDISIIWVLIYFA